MDRRTPRTPECVDSSRRAQRCALLFGAAALSTSVACKSPSNAKPQPLDPNTQATNLRTGTDVPIWGGEHSFHLGERAETSHYAMTFSNVKECEIEPYFPTPEGKVRLGVEVTIEGISTAEVPVNPFYASLVSESGASYESSLAGCKPALRAVRVTKGKQANGWISFKVPRNLAGLKMIYRPVIIGAGVQELRFDLGPSPG